MSQRETAEFKAELRKAFSDAIDLVGLEAFKRTSLFGSNDRAYLATKNQQAA
ncbi:hypothetical protein HNR60_002586 [Rhodopseudomonas rhenobacensis]|uniref:Uncharacterized protein n=1 Tax=Rhodopseudomonas rhenobacensis TaxID=87461 RepID=A0A7W7Z4K1_9BRAD|nr:hypothetical protein [Rhodopseudomonas rhenobacensis]MBB5047829.1 hypothetical protein [Rhodopseudomonas rhenobacensis]